MLGPPRGFPDVDRHNLPLAEEVADRRKEESAAPLRGAALDNYRRTQLVQELLIDP